MFYDKGTGPLHFLCKDGYTHDFLCALLANVALLYGRAKIAYVASTAVNSPGLCSKLDCINVN